MKELLKKTLRIADIVLLPLVFPSAWLLKNIRRVGVERLPLCRGALLRLGVFPIRNHYYEPKFDNQNPEKDFAEDRDIRAIDWNVTGQLAMLERLSFAGELVDLPRESQDATEFHFNNGAFEAGDAEYWYQVIRAVKPRKIFEVGGGYSTLMTIKALDRNRKGDSSYECEHVCIEPYEMPWLERKGVSVVRQAVEQVGLPFFSALQEGDILFIDSSHVIRPQGDVLFEFLELLPSLNKGVIVHVHDIFSPKDYPRQWLSQEIRLWNEQYLLEAFLSHNCSWKIIGALNYLHHNHHDRLKSVAPFLTPENEPASFYMQKIA